MKILVLGAGALGGYYGARLLEAGAEVTFLVRQKRADQLQESGRVVQSPLGNVARTVHTITRDQVTPDAASPWAASMMRDIDHQAPRLEADHIVGDLIRRAQHFGVDVPLMRVAYAHLQVYEARQHQAQDR